MTLTDLDFRPEALTALLAARSDLRLAILFGSRAEDRARPGSDIDLAVAAQRPLEAAEKTALIEAVAESSGLPVDLVDLRTAGEPLLGRILTKGRRLVVRDATLLAELYKRHLFDSADFLPYRQRILVERRKTWIGN